MNERCVVKRQRVRWVAAIGSHQAGDSSDTVQCFVLDILDDQMASRSLAESPLPAWDHLALAPHDDDLELHAVKIYSMAFRRKLVTTTKLKKADLLPSGTEAALMEWHRLCCVEDVQMARAPGARPARPTDQNNSADRAGHDFKNVRKRCDYPDKIIWV